MISKSIMECDFDIRTDQPSDVVIFGAVFFLEATKSLSNFEGKAHKD